MKIEKLANTLERAWRFFPHTLAEYLSRGMWHAYYYLVMISNLITEAIANGNGRIIVLMPPRHGKSELISHYVPVWFLENWPNQNIILSSYEADFAASWGRKVRDTIQKHRNELSVRVSSASSSAARWNTTSGGGMVTAGAGGAITGRGGNLIIVDDPIKNWLEAQSDTTRQRLLDWFYSTLYTRAEPDSTIIIIQTRWHESDLAGDIIAKNTREWQVIRFPALAEADDPLGRKIDEALCPERYDRERLLKIKETTGTGIFEGLYQQHPAPPKGQIFNRNWWRFYDELPDLSVIIQSWDCGFETGSHNSYTVGQTWGMAKNGYYLIDQFRDRLEYTDLIRAVKAQYRKHNPEYVLIEYQASGRSLVQDLYRNTNLPIKAIKSTRDSKPVRAEIVTPVIECGRVHLPKQAHWVNDFLHEMTLFPSGKFSDQVDALSQALGFMKNKYEKRSRGRPSSKIRVITGRKTLCNRKTPITRNSDRRLYFHNYSIDF